MRLPFAFEDDLEVQIEEFEADGFLLVAGLLSSEMVSELRLTALQAIANARRTVPWHPYHSVIFSIHELASTHEEFARLVSAPEPAAVAAHLLGGPVRVLLDQLICKRAGSRATPPHQDAPFLPLGDQPTLNCWIPLEDVGRSNGGLEYYPGSHRTVELGLIHLDAEDDQFDPAQLGVNSKQIPMAPGDCVFHDGKAVHAAGHNRSDFDRLAISIQYMLEGSIAHDPLHPFMARAGIKAGMRLDADCFARPQLLPGRGLD